jgi:hypothetical protein
MTSDDTSREWRAGPDLVIRAARRAPTPTAVNAAMRHLGIDVEWSDMAVAQLAEAAAAVKKYLEHHPGHAQAFVHDPDSVLRAVVDEGLLTTPVDALQAALAATREGMRRRGGDTPGQSGNG